MFESKTSEQTKPIAPKPGEKKLALSGFLVFAEKLINLYYLVTVILVVLLLAVGAMLMVMVYSNDDISTMVTQRAEVLASKQSELAKLQAMKTDYDNLEKSAQRILEVLPEGKNLPEIIVQLEELAKKNNLTMTNINIAEDKTVIEPNQKVNKTEVKKVILTTSLTGGDYFTLKDYLVDIEKNVRLLDIQSLAYSPVSNSYDLMLNTYYLERPKTR
jgi:Tfp pilus assembly protein PilO